MAVEVEIDVQGLKSEIKKTYASVSQEPEKDFIFPTGRPWAEDLGYPEELANVPETAVGSFAGVANPWQLGRLAPGERVLDLGSGAGRDLPRAHSRWSDSDRRRHDPEPGQRRGPQEHRPLDRLNCRGAAGTSVRQAPRVSRLRADRDRPARRHVRPLEVRDTRRKAQKFGARGTTVKAYKPGP
jgi:hypothetical protein